MSSLAEERKKILEEQNERVESVVKTLSEEKITDHIIDIAHSEVYYTLNPRRLPYSRIKFEELAKYLSEKYKLIFRPEDHRDQISSDSQDRMSDLTSGRRQSIMFTGGVYEFKGQRSTEVRSVLFTSEGVLAAVQGRSDISELLIKEVLELVWDLSGNPMRFDEIGRDLQLKTFATETIVDMGVTINSLIDSKVSNTLDSLTKERDSVFFKTIPRLVNAEYQEASGVASWSLDDLKLRLSVYDTVSGRNIVSAVTFSVKTQSDYGGSVLSVATQLPYEHHVSLVRVIIEQLRGSDSQDG